MVPGRPSDRHFYPRPPRGGRPFKVSERCCYYLFLSTSPARGTTFASAPLHQVFYISIHVPREGDDATRCAASAHAEIFLSTSPARGTTVVAGIRHRRAQFLSTSPARGTTITVYGAEGQDEFLSTSPARGMTLDIISHLAGLCISIHVPREGDDKSAKSCAL